MAGYKWCILRDDDRVKDALRYRIKSLNMTVSDAAKIARIRPSQLYDYLNKHDEPRHRVTQEQLMKICRGLGIRIDLNVALL